MLMQKEVSSMLRIRSSQSTPLLKSHLSLPRCLTMEMSTYSCFYGEDIILPVWERDTMRGTEQNRWAHAKFTWPAISFFDGGSFTLGWHGDPSDESRIMASAMLRRTDKFTSTPARLKCWKKKFSSWFNAAAHAAGLRQRPPKHFTWWRLR